MARDPVRRKASREAEKARRRTQTAIANVVNEMYGKRIVKRDTVMNFLKENKDLVNNREISALLKQVAAATSTSGRGKAAQYTESQIKKVRENIDAYSDMRFRESGKIKAADLQSVGAIERRNEITKRNLNQAKSGLSAYSEMDVKRFYAVTQPLWNSAPSNREYNSYIMKRFGIPDLETIYNLLMNKELNYEDFDFQSEEAFNDYIDSFKELRGIDLKKMREIIASSYPSEDDNENTNNLPAQDESEKEGSPPELMIIGLDIARLFM